MNPDDSPIESCFGRGVSAKLLNSRHRCSEIAPSPIADASIIDEYIDMNSQRQGYTA